MLYSYLCCTIYFEVVCIINIYGLYIVCIYATPPPLKNGIFLKQA